MAAARLTFGAAVLAAFCCANAISETNAAERDGASPATQSTANSETDDPQAIVRRLREHGFSEIAAPRRRGAVYVTEAVGPRGDRMRLVLDARTGSVSGLRVILRRDGRPSRSEHEVLQGLTD
jgi:hypothetical protein